MVVLKAPEIKQDESASLLTHEPNWWIGGTCDGQSD
jgi:hypothetical protein